MKRMVKRITTAQRDDIADLQTHRAMPTAQLEMIDPFLFLNHHGPQTYPPHNRGLPFGPHPHRGFETVTFILEGDIAHHDSSGHESVINAGGVQWMTAGKGLIHSEVSSQTFKNQGGPLEILQLWVNLPSRLKMTSPQYLGLQADGLPVYEKEDGKAKIKLVSGTWENHLGPFRTLTDVTTMLVDLISGTDFKVSIPADRNIFFYLVRGKLEVNGQVASIRQTVEFKNEGEEIEIKSLADSRVLLCHAPAFNEPVVSYGPFVMNTREEINQAIRDYQSGKF